MLEALCRQSSTTLDIVHAEDGPPITQRTSGLDRAALRDRQQTCSAKKEWVVPHRQFRMPAKKVVKADQADEERPKQQQPDTERYLLQIDGQTKRSFKTPEAARSAALEIKASFSGSAGIHL